MVPWLLELSDELISELLRDRARLVEEINTLRVACAATERLRKQWITDLRRVLRRNETLLGQLQLRLNEQRRTHASDRECIAALKSQLAKVAPPAKASA